MVYRGHRARIAGLLDEIEFERVFPDVILNWSARRQRSSIGVLDLAEIFEMIFSYLPEREVLQLQAVCKRWFCFITDSPRLQRRLWLTGCGDMGQLAALEKTYDRSRYLCWNPFIGWLGIRCLKGDHGSDFLQHHEDFSHIHNRAQLKEVLGLQDHFQPLCLSTDAFTSWMLMLATQVSLCFPFQWLSRCWLSLQCCNEAKLLQSMAYLDS